MIDRLGPYLRALRKAQHWSQTDAAARAGISRNYLSQLERGTGYRPSVTVLTQLAHAYHVQTVDLVSLVEPHTALREELGQVVRAAWVTWARTQPNPKPSWVAPWDELSETDKEADRCIGMAVAAHIAEALFDLIKPVS
jgi:transcriptional regulator with XRE-family HTH domain